MVIASQCVPVASSWVRQFILTCDNQLAVEFLNGVCCLYPSSSRALFEVAITWASPGKFVHAFLYKRLAYRLIKSPCPAQPCGGGGTFIQTACCANTISSALHATITGGGASNGSYPLTYDGTLFPPGWAGIIPGTTCGIKFDCGLGSTWELGIAGPTYNPASVSCSPLNVVFGNVDLTLCGGTNNATVTVTP
jgi:hypothetical protein